ncbi:hypothetical protein TNCV_2075801 [Trichonephila clavipes]|nr:hypothetical protein TNCV_2075801 [Trichonephila clavipes]
MPPLSDTYPPSSLGKRRDSIETPPFNVEWFKITWSVTQSPRVAEQCDVNIQSINVEGSLPSGGFHSIISVQHLFQIFILYPTGSFS